MTQSILVVGGAGYIGSHMVDMLVHANFNVVVFDNLSSGHRDAVASAKLIIADLADQRALDQVFTQHDFRAVMHFASSINVGESVKNPQLYYQNNVANTINLLNTMVHHDVKQLIFSSTAAVYGEPQQTPIAINHPKNPLNSYGKSKWMVEQILQDYDKAYGLKSISLRYFNAAGAHSQAKLGERHDPETHLIPLLLQVVSGKADFAKLYGKDYPTPDGTCIRDYIHVVDLCQAHLLALDYLQGNHTSAAFNLGNGTGFSVQQVIDAVKQVTGVDIPIKEFARRAGDPAILVADAREAEKLLNWLPQYPQLQDIIAHAWQWELKQQQHSTAGDNEFHTTC